MKILSVATTPKEELVKAACETLQAGGLVVYPTETTYGIGADATNPDAVAKLLQYKSRREGKPLSIAVNDRAMAEHYVSLNDQAKQLYKNFLPGPVTVVSQSTSKVAPGVASERGTIGVRIPDYPLIREILEAYQKPITATGANASYKKRPYNVSDIFDAISDKQKALIDLVIDAGQLPPNEPSTVVDTTLEQPTVLRQGEIAFTDATTITTNNEQETQKLGEDLINIYRNYLQEKALIFALAGEMGAGKTQLSKGIARALKITKPVTSPTYTLSQEYQFTWGDTPNRFVHIDTWRLFDQSEFLTLGFQQMVDSMSIISIEWADKVAETLTKYSDEAKIIWVKMEYGASENERIITYSDKAII
jgi:L-threonylcarbamoyladenylate synthase